MKGVAENLSGGTESQKTVGEQPAAAASNNTVLHGKLCLSLLGFLKSHCGRLLLDGWPGWGQI
jgi:hypothetical protein